MPIITFASSKGGAGKSTSCACLAGALVARKQSVHIVDLDSNGTISRWLGRSDDTNPVHVSSPNPAALTEHLEKVTTSQSPDFILIDVAGSYERAITVAMARAHLTIIPAAPSEADLFEATRVANHLQQVFGAFNREPLYRLLLTQVQALASHAQIHAIREIERLYIPRFQAVLFHRAAYQEIGLSGCPPHLSDTSRPTVTKAIVEIDAWLDETMTLITSSSQGRAAA